MARDFPIGNGRLLINFDQGYNIRDMYYPHVGQENHALDHLSHFGVWCPEGFFWIDDPAFIKKAYYLNDSLVTHMEGTHAGLGIGMTIRDGVDVERNVMLRKVTVSNRREKERTIKLYFHLDLHLYGTPIGDTAYFDPDLGSLVFYKGHRYVSLSCCTGSRFVSSPSGYATGQKEIHGLQGTWRDAEDGQLGGNPIAQGSVDGTIELDLKVPGRGQTVAWFWVCFGKSREEVAALETDVRTVTPQTLLQHTYDFWSGWVNRDRHELDLLPKDIASAYKRSLLLIRTNLDEHGAIIAANDSDILKFAKDTYSYMWPRDGALISHALDRAGYHQVTRRFFDFCKGGITPEGFLMHKYNPDGSPGSSWHPWVNPLGKKQFAIQEDETALVVYTLWHHHTQAETLAQSHDDYERFVIPAADFMAHYRDASGLTLPSYDLWEERYGVMAFTVASVYAGLTAAGNFAEFHGDKIRAGFYRDSAAHLKKAADAQLYDEKEQRFLRALYWNQDKRAYEKDMVIDSSMYALFDFGLVEPDDPRMVRTMEAMKRKLWVQTEIGGMARYENDYYQQVSQDIAKVPGNPWFICTLWYAEWRIAVARKPDDLKEPEGLIRWAMSHALPSGVMAEQVHPYTGAPMSVSPLTWSHASFVKVVQEYLSKLKAFEAGPKKEEDVSDEAVLEGAIR